MKSSIRQNLHPSRRIMLQLAGYAALGLIVPANVLAADDKDKKKPAKDSPPAILFTLPLALSREGKQNLMLRGNKLQDASAVKAVVGDATVEVKIKSKGRAEAPKPLPATSIGDTQVEIELQMPAGSNADEVKFIVVTATGDTEPRAVRLYDPKLLIQEKEPNGGFATAQEIHLSSTIAGLIEKENDIDVFRIHGKAGQKLKAEVEAARLGSPLDSLLSLYDDRHEIVATNDDGDTADSLLEVSLPKDGDFYLTITDAYGNGGTAFAYLLHVSVSAES